MLQRLRQGISWFRGARLFEQGDAFRTRSTGNPAAGLQRAIASYREALRFFTAEANPREYAATQGNLGLAYAELPTGNRAANLEWAIACQTQALRFFTADAAPLEYARTQNYLGNAYRDLPTGDREVNLERAIACYEEALRFLTAEAAPREYAIVHGDLGVAYATLPTGDQAENLERAIACYEEALRFLTAEATPRDYAVTQEHLGLAYAELATGDRQANLERAIACYEQALRFTANVAPRDYAMMQNNLGNAYRELPIGDRQANLERAIACYEQALRFTANVAQREYAMAQDNLGNAYAELPTGDRAANLQRAIACHTEALRFFTAEAAPDDYALAQNNLGDTYFRLPTGDRQANLERAIACYRDALSVWTAQASPRQYAMAQSNLGNAYVKLPTRDRQAHVERAIACYKDALSVWTAQAAPRQYAMGQSNLGNAYLQLPTRDRQANVERAIACYQEALRFSTAEVAPQDYAMVQQNLGLAYGRIQTEDRGASLERAVACYQEALRFWTSEDMPASHRAAADDLAFLYFGEGEWENAHAAYASAITAGNRLYEAAATETGRQAELGEAQELVTNNAYCLARLGRLTEAVECLEGGRARALAEDLARDRAAFGTASSQDRLAFEAARDRIKTLEAEARWSGDGSSGNRVGRPFVELSEGLAAARGELSAVVARIRNYVPEFMAEGLGYAEIAKSARVDRPLVYLLSTTKGSLALIVTRGAPALSEQQAVWLNDFTSDDLDALLWGENERAEITGGLLLGQATGDLDRLESALEHALPLLRERIMGPLADSLGELGLSEATIVPTGRLSLLPLPAAAMDLIVALAPSARALQAVAAAAEHAAGRPSVLLAVGNPLPLPPGIQSLAFAGAEAEAIGRLFGPGSRVLTEGEVTRKAILSHAKGTTHIHFACHGGFDAGEPLDSGLMLSGGERLTLRDLLDEELELRSTRLVVLSACQSGITEFQRVPDEVIGLPAGFIQAGVPGVVSTLWPVNDLSTALLVVEFYRLLMAEGQDPALALHTAKESLRTSTAEQLDLAGWFERLYQTSGGTDRDAFEATTYYRANPNGRPFEDPLYWAGFVFSGV